MTFWQENYPFIKDVYNMRQQKMLEWMENVEKAISRIMADKVYTSAEFKRERDNFHALCKDLYREEVKKWLKEMLEILMAERAKEERKEQITKLDDLIKRHEELVPNVNQTQIKVDLYWKCYAYGDELAPHIEFLDGIMLSSTRDITPSCVENVEELIERQEKSLSQLEAKNNIVRALILKGKALLDNPDKPKFLDSHVLRIEDGWEITKEKATTRLQFLQKTKDAWVGYADAIELIGAQFEKADEEMKRVKKRFNLASAVEDLEKRQQIFNENKTTIETLYKAIQDTYDIMTMTLPDEKKDFLKKEVKAITERLECIGRFNEKVSKIEDFVANLTDFDKTLKSIDKWMMASEKQLEDMKECRDSMTPEDRVSHTMELQEDISCKVKIIQENIAKEEGLLPQGDTVPKDAQDYKDELLRIEKFVLELQKKVIKECEMYSEDIKFWAEYKTGIKEFKPWLENAEKKTKEGIPKPQTLEDANALYKGFQDFVGSCVTKLQILNAATGAANNMTTHKDVDVEVAELNERYNVAKKVADDHFAKIETLVKEWRLLDSTVCDLNSWVAEDRKEGEQQFSLEKMESTLGELKNIFKEKERLVEEL
jgi:uncharacterized protein YozE (UPF0346 family)